MCGNAIADYGARRSAELFGLMLVLRLEINDSNAWTKHGESMQEVKRISRIALRRIWNFIWSCSPRIRLIAVVGKTADVSRSEQETNINYRYDLYMIRYFMEQHRLDLVRRLAIFE